MLAEAAMRQAAGQFFHGLVYAHPVAASVGDCIRDLELIATASSPADFEGTVLYLPL